MKAVEIRAFGGPEGLAVIDLPDPSPADGQVLIATEAIGLGGVDAVIRSGAIAGYGFKAGHILGSEVAGTVTAVSGGVEDMPSFFARLNPNGRMVVVGLVAGYPPADFGMTMMAAFQKSLSFATFSTDTVPEPDRRAVRTGLFEAASRGELQMVVHEVLPLEPVAAAPGRSQCHQVTFGVCANCGLQVACWHQVDLGAEDGLQFSLDPSQPEQAYVRRLPT